MPGTLVLNAYVHRRMAQRRISEEEIEEALASPSITYPSEQRPDRLVVLGDTRSGRRLKVVVRVDDPRVLVTVADRDTDD